MGRAPCCEKVGLKRGRWTADEDEILTNYIQAHGKGSWRALPKRAGLQRCGKSCRLRWTNYLRGDIKRGNFTAEEEDTIFKLHRSFGNRWSFIASHLSGRTDNEIKNYWNTHLSGKMYSFRSGSDCTMLGTCNEDTECKRRYSRVSGTVSKKYNQNMSYFPRSRNHQQINVVSSNIVQGRATEQTKLVKDAQTHNVDYERCATTHANVEIVEKRSQNDQYPQQAIDGNSDEILIHDMCNQTSPLHSKSKECTSDSFILSPFDLGKGIQAIEQQGKEVDVNEILLNLPDLDIDKCLLSLEKDDMFYEENKYFGESPWNFNSQSGDHDATYWSSPTHFDLDDLWSYWNLEDSAQTLNFHGESFRINETPTTNSLPSFKKFKVIPKLYT